MHPCNPSNPKCVCMPSRVLPACLPGCRPSSTLTSPSSGSHARKTAPGPPDQPRSAMLHQSAMLHNEHARLQACLPACLPADGHVLDEPLDSSHFGCVQQCSNADGAGQVSCTVNHGMSCLHVQRRSRDFPVSPMLVLVG